MFVVCRSPNRRYLPVVSFLLSHRCMRVMKAFWNPISRIVLLATALLLGGASPALAQDNAEACTKVLKSIFNFEGDTVRCRVLAVSIEDSISSYLNAAAQESQRSIDRALEQRLTPRSFQVPQGEVGNSSGTPVQAGAAPSIEAVGLAGGNLAVSGTEAGTRTLATAALNPASLFGGPDGGGGAEGSNRADSLSVALSNLGDVTFIVPVEDIDEAEALDYLGVRARVNVTALTQGVEAFQTVEDEWRKKVERKWVSVLQETGRLTGQITEALEGTDDVAACADALLRVPETGIEGANSACNTNFEPIALTQEDFAELRTLTEAALAEADDAYFGLNLRFDEGDPTLGVTDSARGTRLYAGVGWGRRYGEATSTRTTIRVNGGVKFVDLDATEDAVFAVEGGLDLAFSRTIDKQRLEGSAGLSFSVGDVREAFEAAAETNYLRGRLSVNVPLATNYGLSINLATPIIGEVGTTLSVKTSTHLLLPERN